MIVLVAFHGLLDLPITPFGCNRAYFPILKISSSDLLRGQVAQSVEQWTENPRVGSSILPLATTHQITDTFT